MSLMARSFVLPPALQRALKSGVWTERGRPKDGVWTDKKHIELICAVMKWPYDSKPEPVCFSLEGMIGDIAFWDDEPGMYLGTPHPTIVPGTVDPKRTLIIGEMDYETPFALDYRTSPPSVIQFHWEKSGQYWKKIADSIEELLERLEMEV